MLPVRSTCCYCGVGCGVLIEVRDGRIVGVQGDPEHPANYGRLCSKGRTLHLTVGLSGRALQPELRAARSEARQRVSWDEALEHAAARFAEVIRAHGPDAVAFYVSGQLLSEDYYVFNKLARALVGTNNIDSNSRLCMSSAASAYTAALGADAPPACYDDVEHADCLLIAGSNAAWAHPVLFRRIEDAKRRRPEMRIVVVDPRRTATAELADLHLAIEPGSDIALFNGMLHVMLWEGLVDTAWIDAHTEGFEALRATVREYTPRFSAQLCGLREEQVLEAARYFGRARAALSLYCMGLNQSTSGTAKNRALINLHLASGQIGRPGAGPFSLTGQPNAMGGREIGAMANLLIGHRDLNDPAERAEVARLWGVDGIPARPGKTAVAMFEALRRGEIKALWIACTNPAQSLPDQARVREALERAEFVVLQEAFAGTETGPYADLLLPAATWGEKAGTVTNSERRVSRVREAIAAPGEARADWRIAADFAQRLEQRLRPGSSTLFPYSSPQEVFDEYREATRGRDTDITGLSYALLEKRGPQQWPYPESAREGKARLYTDGVFATANGRARFAPAAYRAPAERVDARYPFRLTTGRLRDQWHAMSRTGRSARLFGHAPEPRLALSAADLARRMLRAGDLVHVESRRGRVTLIVESSDALRPGQAFLPMHWGARFLSGRGALGVNAVTLPALDPDSEQPELKHCTVRVTRAELPWRLVAFAQAPDGDALRLLEALQAIMARVAFATVGLMGGAREGVLLRLAAALPLEAPLIEELDGLLGLAEERVLRYDDARRGVGRRVCLGDDGALRGVRLCGDIAGEDWLRELFQRGAHAATLGRALLSPGGAARGGRAHGKVVCSCWNVGEAEIAQFLASGPPSAKRGLGALQDALKCGTGCGSCLPELRQLVGASRAAA